MKKLILLVALFCFSVAWAEEQRPTHVYLIGDSTCANKNLEKENPERGWGQLFRSFFKEEVFVENHAMNGRSTKSFRAEGRWEPIYSQMQPGDYVFIQFGHNDEKVDRPKVGSVPEVFAENLRRYVRETREKGGIPVLLTPIARRHFTAKGELIKTHGEYPDRVRQVAEEEDVVLLDMEPLTEAWLKELGDEPSRDYFMWVKAGTSPLYPDGREDNTHLNVQGAHVLSRMVAAQVEEKIPELAKHFAIADLVVAKDGTGDFFTLKEAIDAVPDYCGGMVKIRLSEGLYREKISIPWTKRNVHLYGVGKAVVSWDDFATRKNMKGLNIGTSGSSTIFFGADNWLIENITFENTAGRVGQAVAVQTLGTNIRFKGCRFLGDQDTLYLHGEGNKETPQPSTQWNYFEDCYIEGTVDFIFGSAAGVFKNCTIHSKSNSYVTAASTIVDQEVGFVFVDCRLTAAEGITRCYLGRPWRLYARTVFINCELGDHILPAGWHDWGKPEAHTTAYYGEYGSKGPGADPQNRIGWSKQLTRDEAEALAAKCGIELE
ncbi:MAG: pectinesterase family protein [Rikenellaceae bacterium]|nr:pectinesterase family protein [Rikenellaceae bacterium]